MTRYLNIMPRKKKNLECVNTNSTKTETSTYETNNTNKTIDNLNKAIQNLNLPQFLDNFLKGSAANTSITVIDAISLRIAQFVVSAISFVAVFVLALIVLRIVGVILRKVVRINPFLRWVDVVFGGVVRIFLFFAAASVRPRKKLQTPAAGMKKAKNRIIDLATGASH